MATQTQTLRRPAVQAERVHDYLYDPHYIVSSERDHARATFVAHTSTDRVKRVPQYPTMFSELRHHPRFQMRLDVTDPVPKFISRQWRGYGQQAREALVRHTTFNYDPSVKVPLGQYEDPKISGQNRYKYFRRPIIPFLQQMPPDVVLASSRQDPLAGGIAAEQAAMLERPMTPLVKTVMTQTDYRESEAQTDPYTPEYVVRPGSQPELLTLATLSYGRGLPAGLAEVEMIERARAKRAWESTLPPLNDMNQLEKRRKMMDDMERREWALRESEIEKLQETRLEVLKKLLKEREEKHQELNTKRLDRLWAKKQEEKEERVKKIRNEHIKTIRKLTEKRRKVENKFERRDVTHEYSDCGSQTYAPLTRIGVFLDRNSEQYVVKSRFLNTYQGLLELEQSLPDFVTQPRIRAPKPRTVTKSGFTKRKYRQERELEEIHQVMKDNRMRVEEPPKPLRFLQKIEKPVPRPPTPGVEVPSEEEEDVELSVIFLQQVLRGRAIQNMMFEGKEKRIELIRELRSTHALQEAEQQMKKQERLATLALQRQRRLHDHKESFVDEGLAQLEGESLGDMLDFLSKELIRLKEERRIHAFSMLAERQRRIREAEESGRRQVEERIRRQEDEVFKQVIKVHQNTVDGYLEDIIMNSVDITADEQAREEIKELAEKINDVAYEMEDKRTELESEEIVSELVHSFLLPEVQKTYTREKIRMQQRKYLNAAHSEIHREGEQVIDRYPRQQKPPTPVQQTTPPGSSRPESAAEKPPTPAQSRPASRSVSQTGSRPASQTGSRPASRPTSARSEGKSSSRRASATSVKSQKSGTATPERQASLDLSIQGKGSRPSSAASQKEAAVSQPGTPKSSKPATPVNSKPVSRTATPQTSNPPTPKGSKQATPVGSRAATPQENKENTPVGSNKGTPQGSRTATPQQYTEGTPPPAGSKVGTPVGSKPGTPQGSKSSTPQGSRTATPRQIVSPTSPPATPQGYKSPTPRDSKAGTPVASQPATPTGSRPSSRKSSVHSNK